MRHPFKALTTTVFLLAVAACADVTPTSAPTRQAEFTHQSCDATLATLLEDAEAIFGAPNGPNWNSVRGKLTSMQMLLTHRSGNKVEQGQARAHEIVAFTLKMQEQGRLRGTPQQVAEFVNDVFCFAGIDVEVPDTENTFFILPSDQPQTLIGLDGTAAVSLPANPVSEPSLLRFEPFDGQLNTKLDQYPGFVRITLLNDGNTGLTGRATITVCAVEVPDDVPLERLRLGHGIRDTGFVITPLPMEGEPSATELDCEPDSQFGLAKRIWNAITDVVGPRTLHASATRRLRFGGVSGTVTEFSPFAPVDTELRFGGVSGSVTEFLIAPQAALILGEETASSASSCEERLEGEQLPPECFPVVSVRTFQGTVLENVPVRWSIPDLSPGKIAARSGDLGSLDCGAYGRTAQTVTSARGNAGVCWGLVGTGLHQVVARASAGGDAPEGVSFSNDGADSVLFEVLVTEDPSAHLGKPTNISVVEGSGQSGPAGRATATAPSVLVTDPQGNPIANVTVYWQVQSGSGGVGSATSVTDADGRASTTWTLGEGDNQLKAFITDYWFAYVYFSGTGTAP